jgi:hypothetical protein
MIYTSNGILDVAAIERQAHYDRSMFVRKMVKSLVRKLTGRSQAAPSGATAA